jgi:hypothetical protein
MASMTVAARDPQLVAEVPVVRRMLSRNSKLKFSGSVWRLGRQALTTTTGELTSLGHAYRMLHPVVSLSHYNRETQRITGRQVRVRDAAGRNRVVATMVDGKFVATNFGQAYYGTGSRIFRAYVPAWAVGSEPGSPTVRTSVTLDDAWLEVLPNYHAVLAELRVAIYTEPPEVVSARIIELIRQAAEVRHLRKANVPADPIYDLPDTDGRVPTRDATVAVVDGYDGMIFVDLVDITPSQVRLSVYAPGYNNRARNFIKEIKRRPLRGEVLLDDELVRKTGLLPEAWLSTGRCTLFQMQKVVTCRRKQHTTEEERFTLDELEAIFDEAWELELEHDTGSRPGAHPNLYEAFLPFADLLGSTDPGALEEALKHDNSPCRELRKVIQRFFGWQRGQWDDKLLRVLDILSAPPRQFDDWRQTGVTPELLERICTRTVNPLVLLKGEHIIHRFDPPGWENLTPDMRRDHQPIVLSVNAGHAFFYKCPNARRDIQKMRLDYQPAFEKHAKLASHQERSGLVPFSEMVPFDADALDDAIDRKKTTCFHSSDIDSLVQWFRAHRSTVSFKAFGDMKSTSMISVHGLGRGVSIRVKRVSQDAPLLDRVATDLRQRFYDIHYYGSEMPSFVNSAVEAILVKPRRYLSRDEERRCREAYHNECARCGCRERLEYDHIVPLSQGGSNDFDNFQVLCRECHAAKTQETDRTRPHILASQLSVGLREIFLSTPKPRQQSGSNWQEVLDAHNMQTPSEDHLFDVLDVVGCRRNALLQRKPRKLLGGKLVPRHLPIFAPSDEPEEVGPATWQDMDFVWLEIPDCDPHDPAVWEQVRPYNGSHYYPVETAEELVNFGIINAKSITKGIRASRHLASDELARAWDEISGAMARVEPHRAREFQKLVYLHHLGYWSIPVRAQSTVVHSTIPEDVPSEDLTFSHFDGKVTLGYETQVLDNRSYFPLSLIALYGEQVAMCKLWRMVRASEASIGRPLAGAHHIDGIALVKVPAQLKKRVREVKYPDGTFQFAIKSTPYRMLPRHKERLLETGNRVHPPRQPRRSVDEHDLEAELGGRVTDSDWFEKLARLLFDNGGGMVTGPGGCGKTRGLLASFRKLAEQCGQVTRIVALTHVAARIARGTTLERFLLQAPQHNTNSIWVIVDEASQIPQSRWAELQRLKLIGVKFLVVGDFAGQLRPPSGLWSDARRRYESCDDLWKLAEGLEVRLSEYRRGRNLNYFKTYCALYADVPEDDAAKDNTERVKLAEHVRRLRSMLPWDGDHRGLHVVMSNDKRKLINRICNAKARAARPDAVFVKSPDDDRPTGEPSFWCYTGQQLQARHTDSKTGTLKNVLYDVQAANSLECILRMSGEYAEDAENIQLPISEIGRHFRMAYAVVYLNVQGRTISTGSVVLWDTLRGTHVHRHITLRHFIMGLQRVTDPSQLKIASHQQEVAFLGTDLPEPAQPLTDDGDDEEEEEEDEPEELAPAPKRARR